ncbi:MAG: phenylacetic acid degradation operon negative regulatory protein PaaX [Candidatus Accumulibacter sp. 66-26]|nr:phenylacetic acid degradation operon negative regulatory protein PaaX [Accumulibacter sp.]OJW52043.1 MAG: phenylacetic acid degradation operon negative regulatory protein PaaX [Candidatus Accumulibacter sp. 66-26]
MTHPIRARIDEFSQQKRVHANSLIISVFGDMVVPRGGRIWLGSLIRLLEPLGLNERLVRTSVFRLAKEEWLRTEALGRRSDYLLTPHGQRRFDEASRHIYASYAPLWDRRWRLILGVGQLEQKDRDALRRALFWQGFGALGSDCFVHPSTDLSAAFDALVAEGLGHLIGGLMPLLAADSRLGGTASNADLVARAWNLSELSDAYAQFVATYMPALAELRRDRSAEIDEEEAFLMRLLLIHDYRRLLLRDPELPDVLVPAGWPGQTARVLCKELYRRLLAPSERHLDRCFSIADGSCPPFDPAFLERFPEDDPLAAIAP